jgi:hypothetical protein
MSVIARQPLLAAAALFALIAPALAQGDVSFSDRANVMVQQTAPSAARATPVAAAKAAEPAEAIEVDYGADPDPAYFDREGLERWWAKYTKKHPTR